MQPTLCSRCKKNIAVVFIAKMEGDQTTNEGLCLKCAKDLGLPQVDEMIKRMGISDEDLDQFAAGRLRMAVIEGDEKEGCFLAGQSAGMVTKEQTCAEIIADLMQDADRVLGELQKWEK